MTEIFLVMIAGIWIIQLVRVLVWLMNSRSMISRYPRDVLSNCTKIKPRPWPDNLSMSEREGLETFRRRFVRQYYVLLGVPAVLAGTYMIAVSIFDIVRLSS